MFVHYDRQVPVFPQNICFGLTGYWVDQITNYIQSHYEEKEIKQIRL